MKLKVIICSYFVIFTIFLLFAPNSIAYSDYKIGVKEGDEFIWNCYICDNEVMDLLFGKKWDAKGTGIFEDLEQGTRMKYYITDTNTNSHVYSSKTKDNETALSIEFNKWSWSKKSGWGNKDSKGQLFHFEDPEDYSEDYIFPQLAPLWLPLSMGEYLKNMDLDNGYTIDARVLPSLTCEINKNEIEDDYPNEEVKVVAMYTEQGILNSYKLYLKDHQVIIDIALESFISMNLPLLTIISVILYFSIVFFIYKILKV